MGPGSVVHRQKALSRDGVMAAFGQAAVRHNEAKQPSTYSD